MKTKKPSVKKVTKKKVVIKKLSKRERIAKDSATYKAEHEQYLKDVTSCEHQCSGNCRRNGCNCKCGEYCQRDEVETFLKENGYRGSFTGTQVPTSRFADKDFDLEKFPSAISRLAPRVEQALNNPPIIDLGKPTAFPYEIEGEPAFNCNKWTAMAVVIILLGIVTYAMHGDYQALTSGLIN